MFLPFMEAKSFGVSIDCGDSGDGIEDDGDVVSYHVQGEYFAVFGAKSGDVGFLTEEEGDCYAQVGNPTFFKRRFRLFSVDDKNMVEVCKDDTYAKGIKVLSGCWPTKRRRRQRGNRRHSKRKSGKKESSIDELKTNAVGETLVI